MDIVLMPVAFTPSSEDDDIVAERARMPPLDGPEVKMNDLLTYYIGALRKNEMERWKSSYRTPIANPSIMGLQYDMYGKLYNGNVPHSHGGHLTICDRDYFMKFLSRMTKPRDDIKLGQNPSIHLNKTTIKHTSTPNPITVIYIPKGYDSMRIAPLVSSSSFAGITQYEMTDTYTDVAGAVWASQSKTFRVMTHVRAGRDMRYICLDRPTLAAFADIFDVRRRNDKSDMRMHNYAVVAQYKFMLMSGIGIAPGMRFANIAKRCHMRYPGLVVMTATDVIPYTYPEEKNDSAQDIFTHPFVELVYGTMGTIMTELKMPVDGVFVPFARSCLAASGFQHNTWYAYDERVWREVPFAYAETPYDILDARHLYCIRNIVEYGNITITLPDKIMPNTEDVFMFNMKNTRKDPRYYELSTIDTAYIPNTREVAVGHINVGMWGHGDPRDTMTRVVNAFRHCHLVGLDELPVHMDASADVMSDDDHINLYALFEDIAYEAGFGIWYPNNIPYGCKECNGVLYKRDMSPTDVYKTTQMPVIPRGRSTHHRWLMSYYFNQLNLLCLFAHFDSKLHDTLGDNSPDRKVSDDMQVSSIMEIEHEAEHAPRCVLLGDLNAEMNDVAYTMLIQKGWIDIGPYITSIDGGKRIDYMFVRGVGINDVHAIILPGLDHRGQCCYVGGTNIPKNLPPEEIQERYKYNEFNVTCDMLAFDTTIVARMSHTFPTAT